MHYLNAEIDRLEIFLLVQEASVTHMDADCRDRLRLHVDLI